MIKKIKFTDKGLALGVGFSLNSAFMLAPYLRKDKKITADDYMNILIGKIESFIKKYSKEYKADGTLTKEEVEEVLKDANEGLELIKKQNAL